MKEFLKQKIKEIVKEKYNEEVDPGIERPKDASYGDLSTNISMVLAGKLKRNPLEIAEEIGNELKAMNLENISGIEVVRPGFVNFRIDNSIFKKVLVEVLEKKEKFGIGVDLKGKRIMMEYAHPNPFKSFHIGHLRNIILGESLIRLIESQGAEVIRVNYQGDVGMHIAKCIWSFLKVDPKDYPETNDEKVALLGKCYSEGATAFEENEEHQREIKEINKKIYSRGDEKITELWELGKKWSLDKFHEIYERLGSTFEREYMETEVMDLGVEKVKEAIDKGILKESEGAVIFDGSEYGLDTRVFLNSEKLPTYEGKELGLAYKEFTDYGEIDLCIHNVAIEQISFFKVTFKVEELLDQELFKGKQYHNAYEFVGLKKGKMSSRKGNVVLGNDILNEAVSRLIPLVKDEASKEETAEKLGVASVKYSFLKISPKTYLAFDFDESLSLEGDSGPYLMYTYARAKSILKDSNEGEYDIDSTLNSEEEIEVLKLLNIFPERVQVATKEYAPNLVANYLFDLAQAFNKFYNTHSVLNADNIEDKNARLALVSATAQVLKNGLNLLGIETVEKM